MDRLTKKLSTDLVVPGLASVTASGRDTRVMLVVAAVPEVFGSHHTYGYTVRITREAPGVG